ncbi:MAG: amidohydrolase/deacetylase family metallohydrolase [Chloroflexi bacterium]|nr:amidohydrolase/deacetylase family metallohydrolase [Chloroflexota bacterium]
MHDLVVAGGRVIDPAQGIDSQLDIGILNGKVEAIARDVGQGRQVLDATGKIVTPGLIDLHCHVSGGIQAMAPDPDLVGVNQCVTTVVDGGSTGAAIFVGFPRHVVPSSLTRVFCFLHLSSIGLSILPELRDQSEIDLKAIAATIRAYPRLIKGVKVRLVGNLVARDGVKVIETAKGAAAEFGLPIMMHIGDPHKQVSPGLTEEALRALRPGDIAVHIYTAQHGSALGPDGTVCAALEEARDRGVVLDAAMGRTNFSFRVARTIMDRGILPTTVSTDLTYLGLKKCVYGMTVTMSKFMALGMGLTQVIERATVNPALALGEADRIGSLRPGMEADVSVLEMKSGRWKLEDSEGQTVDADKLLSPSATVRAGKVIPANPVAQPQQWQIAEAEPA